MFFKYKNKIKSSRKRKIQVRLWGQNILVIHIYTYVYSLYIYNIFTLSLKNYKINKKIKI